MIFISAIFVNNIVLSQFLGICPFLGVSKKIDTSLGMSAAVAFVLTLATIVTWLVQKYVLDAFGLQYLQTIAFILVIASLVQMVEIVLKKVSPALYQALGIFLPLITTNCAVLGVAILVIQKDYNLLQSVVYAFSTAIGFGVALTVFAGMREQLELVKIPKGMQGVEFYSVAFSSDPDDHPGGSAWRAAADVEYRGRRGTASSVRYRHGRRSDCQPGADAVHHAGDLSAIRPPGIVDQKPLCSS